MVWILRLLIIMAASVTVMSYAMSSRLITYSWPESMLEDERSHFPIALLHLALSKSDKSYQLRPSKTDLAQQRTIQLVATQGGTDVVWTFTTAELEQKLQPIRIPIDRGLLGWRLLLIRATDEARFAALSTTAELAAMTAVQGHDWPDVKVLQQNNFKVVTGANYQGLFEMLRLGRADYFPRSINEIHYEHRTQSKGELLIAEGLALFYPAPMYYFVNKEDTELAQAIDRGLREAIADGSFRTLFLQHFADDIEQAKLNGRKIFRLENPELSDLTPLSNRELWFDPLIGY